VVAAVQPVGRRGQDRAAPVDEDVVDCEQGQPPGALWSPGGGQPVACLAGRVEVAAAQEPAELRVIEGGVEVSGEDARTVTGRGQRGQLTAPPGRGVRGPGRLRRRRVYAGQLHGLPRRKVKPRGAPGGRHRRRERPAAHRVAGVDAASRAVRRRLRHLVREQIAQSGPLEPGRRLVGEFLHEQHVCVLTANQLDNLLGHGPAEEQIRRQDPQHGPHRARLALRYRARAHRGGQGGPGHRGRCGRPRALHQQRAGPRARGYLRGERQQRHGPRFGEPEAISARQPGSRPAGQRAGHRPLQVS